MSEAVVGRGMGKRERAGKEVLGDGDGSFVDGKAVEKERNVCGRAAGLGGGKFGIDADLIAEEDRFGGGDIGDGEVAWGSFGADEDGRDADAAGAEAAGDRFDGSVAVVEAVGKEEDTGELFGRDRVEYLLEGGCVGSGGRLGIVAEAGSEGGERSGAEVTAERKILDRVVGREVREGVGQD